MRNYIYLLFALIILSINPIFSAPLENFPVVLTQPDGTKINCFMSGDEYFNYYHTRDGYFIKQGRAGFYYYADQAGNDIITTNYLVNKYNPTQINIAKNLKPNFEKIQKEINFKNNKQFKNDNNKLQNMGKGTLNNIVIFIKFADDQEYSNEVAKYDSLHNDLNNYSVRNFYKEASFNNLDVVSHLYPISNKKTVISVTDIHKREYYLPYDEQSNPNGYKENERNKRERQLISRALDSVKNQILSDIDFDLDKDGYIDNISFIVKGSPTAWSSLLWPHRNWFYGEIEINNLKVRDYNFNLSDLSFDRVYGLGTICHEFFHTLGSPDLYHYSYDGRVPVGSWDLMGQNTNPPQLMSNFLKWQYTGWITELPEITEEGKYELKPISSPKGSIYKIKPRNDNDSNEYFILEYRKKEGIYDKMLPGSGLLVYKIDKNLEYRGNGYGAPDEIYLYRPNGDLQNEGNIGSANLSKDVFRTSIGTFTNPQLFLNSENDAGLEIFNISECSETITFEITFNPRTIIKEPQNLSIDQTLKPIIKWQKINSAKLYDIEIAEDYDFNKIIFSKNKLSDTLLQIQNELKKGRNYFIRVKWSNNNTISQWSDVCQFSTIQDKTVLLEPQNNSKNISIKTKFIWKENINNNYYKILVSENQDFKNTAFSKTFLKDTVIETAKVFKTNTKYYWKIISKSLTNFDTESEIYTFVTKENEIITGDYSNSKDVCMGDGITLFANAIGTKANYKWYFNDNELIDENDSLIIIENIQLNHQGRYKCIAYNDELNISAEFPEIIINVVNLADFDTIPRIKSIEQDTNIVLSLKPDKQYYDPINTFKLQWFKNDDELFDGANFRGTRSLNLTIIGGANQLIDDQYKLRIISKCGDTIITKYYSKIAQISEYYNKNDVVIFPNPATNILNISFQNYSNVATQHNNINYEILLVQIYDIFGQNILTEKINSIDKNYKINIEKLNSGVYFLKIGNIIEKFIKYDS